MAKGQIFIEQVIPKAVKDVIAQLRQDIADLEQACTATVPITRAGIRCGYGVDQNRKNMQVDMCVARLRAVKTAVKGW